MKRLIVFLFIAHSFAVGLFAQNNPIGITDADLKDIQKQASLKIWQFGEYLGYLADSQNKSTDKLKNKRKTLNLFIHKGEGYPDNNGKWHDGVKMEVSNVKSGTTYPKLLKKYLERLINQNYPKVYFETTDVAMIEVGPLRHIGGNEYECTGYFEQTFRADSKEGKLIYGDITRKSVTVHVFKEQVEVVRPGQSSYQFIIFLGDVGVSETKLIK